MVARYYIRFAQLPRMPHKALVPLAQVFWRLCWRPEINIGDLPLSGK